MDPIKEWWIEERAKKAIEKLEAHDFKAIFVKNKEEAVVKIWKHVTPEQKVGVGGSVTIRELGILDRLETQGNILFNHWKPGLSKEELLSIRKSQMNSDLFLSSINAVTLDGEIVNIDGIGNRVNSIIFGPKKVILVAGYNKIVEDVQEAIKRIKNVAAPLNARRLNIDVPCAKAGECVDCSSPNRICRAMVILERRPSLTDMLIILVGEELGF
jgi:L-lactate utilization protein LutB